MAHNLVPFAAVNALINQGVSQLLSNATATWQGSGHAFGVVFKREQADGYMSEAVTAAIHTVSLCVANAPGIAEGSEGLRINGQVTRITGPVVPDASGWATFPIVFTEGAHAGP
ncbi:hypothetical protein [Comamonas sp.]|uniref:hypothetical protein n=1 Tax=Comamonas sp. TaxID=34028 RepID=UPI0028967361|nr:hypothetical protein [Comamonas sp.]